MKKLLLAAWLLAIMGGVIYATDEKGYFPAGNYMVVTPDNYAATLSSTTVSTVAISNYCSERIISNSGTSTIYISYELKATAALVRSDGFPLVSGAYLIEDKYNGTIYITSKAGAAGEIRVTEVRQK